MHGALHKEIFIRWYKEDSHWVVDVQDTGVGFTEDIRAKAFDPFFTTKSGGTGSGIGLTVVRNVVQGARGRVMLLNPNGQGTLVRLILPDAVAGAMDFIEPANPAHEATSELIRKPKVRMQGEV